MIGLGLSLWRGARDGELRDVIAPLFAGLYDPSDIATMYQGRTGTTAAAIGSPVGQLLDVSGNGRHLVALSDSGRPVLRESGGVYWLEADGTDDGMDCVYSQSDYPLTLCASAGYAGASQGFVISVSGSDSIYRSIYNTSGAYAWQDRNAATLAGTEAVGTNTDPKVLLAAFTNSSANLIADGVDSTAAGSNTNSWGAAIRIDLLKRGATGLSWFRDRFYGGGVIAGSVTLQQRKRIETWLSIKNGRYADVLNGAIFEGDSITAGASATSNNGYVQQLRDTGPRFQTNFLQAVSGNTMADIASRLSTTTSRIGTMQAAGLRPIVTLLTGANDRPATVGAAQTLFASIQSYAASVRATGAKVVMFTAIASDPSSLGAWDGTGRPELNRLIRLNASDFDAVGDFAAVSGLNVWSATNYADNLHPNSTGHGLMLPVALAAVNSVRASSYA